MRADHGYTMGYLPSAGDAPSARTIFITERYPLGFFVNIKRILFPHPTVCRWYLGDVPRFRRRRPVLGLRTCQW